MKIAMLTNNYRPFVGGVPVSVERQARELIRLGHKVTVFAPTYGDTEAEDEAAPERVVRYHSQRRTMDNGMVYPGFYPREILKVFEEEAFDCIHVHHPMFVGQWALYLGKKYGIPVIYTYHTRYEDYLHYIPCFRVSERSSFLKKHVVKGIGEKIVPAYMKWFADRCDMVLAPSAGMRQIIRCYGAAVPVEVFPTGLDDSFFQVDRERASEIRERYGKGKKYLFSTVSRLEKEKNYGFLLRGIAEFRHRYGDDFQVMILGDGSQKGELKVRASLLGIHDVVTFVGNVPNHEVKDYLAASDVFLFASKSETQGIVLAEAMAAGKPVVAVHAVGSDDIIKDGVNGYLTEEDETAWAEHVKMALEKEKGRKMMRQALRTAENYRSSRLALYEEMLYNQCICGKKNELRLMDQQYGLNGERKEGSLYEDEETGRESSAVVIR